MPNLHVDACSTSITYNKELYMNNYTTNNSNKKPQSIEKYSGTFSKQDGGCTILVNKTINMINNLDALGLYSYLSCRPATWTLNPKHLSKHFHCGKDKIYKCIDILISKNVLTRTEQREKGRFVKYHYEILMSPINTQPVQTTPLPENPDTVKPDAENPDTYKTKSVVNKEGRFYRDNARAENSEPTDSNRPEKNDWDNYPALYEQKENELAVTNENGLTHANSAIEGFEKFWELYPRKVNKLRAQAQWTHDGCEPYTNEIIERLKQQIEKDKAFKDGFVPNTWKYLVEKRYLDEPFEGKKSHYDHTDTSWMDKKDIFDD